MEWIEQNKQWFTDESREIPTPVEAIEVDVVRKYVMDMLVRHQNDMVGMAKELAVAKDDVRFFKNLSK
jgi:hypothetical protein